MAQKLYQAKKHFSSALVGGKIPGDRFFYGEESAQRMIDDGLIELVEETKPAPKADIETKPRKQKKAKK